MSPVVNATDGALDPFSTRANLNYNLLPDLVDMRGGDAGNGDAGGDPTFLQAIPVASAHGKAGTAGLCSVQLPPLSISVFCNH